MAPEDGGEGIGAEEAAAAVAAEEREWRVFLARHGHQFYFAREGPAHAARAAGERDPEPPQR